MTSKREADARLVDAHDLALDALREITPATSIGPAAGYLLEDDGSVSLRFENRLPGYPGWFWTATVARVEDEEPTVLEVELIPGDGALLAPEWVPWAERLAEYRAHQAELAERAAAEGAESVEGPDGDDIDDEDDADLDDDDLDDDELDDDDDAELGTVLHAGDVDGVDIDELDPSVSDEDAVDDDSDEDDDESEHDDSDDDEADPDDEE